MDNQYLHELVIAAIILKEGKFLIVKRSPSKKRFPNKWTVPGGRLETKNYLELPKDTEFYWYNVLEQTLRREVKEEVGLEIGNIRYVTSSATVHTDGTPSLVISCTADFVGGEVELQKEEADEFVWVNLEEAGKYDLLDGIYEELVMVDRMTKGEMMSWKRID